MATVNQSPQGQDSVAVSGISFGKTVVEQTQVPASLLGKNTSVSIASVSGVFNLDDQIAAKRAETWPLVPEPELEPDPDFSGVGLLLHMDGSNGSTSFTDSSSNNLTVSVFGDAQVSTSNPKFGSGSLLLDGTGDYLSVPDNPDWDFGTGDYTVEAWIYLPSTVIGNAPIVARGTPAADRGWGLRFLGSFLGTMRLSWYRASQTAVIVNWSPSVDTWYHVAACRSGTSLRFFVDGSQVGSTATDNQDYDARTYTVRVGHDGTNFFPGRIDEVRVTKGVARYTSNFTPPDAPFPDI
jgi:hypothetical protein